MFPWLQALEILAPLLQGHPDHPHTQAAQQLATQTVKLVSAPATPAAATTHQSTQIDHLGQIFGLLLSSGLIARAQVPESVTPAAVAQ